LIGSFSPSSGMPSDALKALISAFLCLYNMYDFATAWSFSISTFSTMSWISSTRISFLPVASISFAMSAAESSALFLSSASLTLLSYTLLYALNTAFSILVRSKSTLLSSLFITPVAIFTPQSFANTYFKTSFKKRTFFDLLLV
jgi:hypothetical protein